MSLRDKKSEKHSWFEVVRAKYARDPSRARMRTMHIATENMWFLQKVRGPLLKPFISIITVIAHQLKMER